MLKRVTSLLFNTFLVLVVLLAAATKEAYAYIDISTGSFMIQMLVAVAFSSLFAVKLFWQRLFSKVSRLFSRIRGSHLEVK